MLFLNNFCTKAQNMLTLYGYLTKILTFD